MSQYVHKSHNVSVLIYHYVCPTKYRKVAFDNKDVDKVLKDVCLEIENRYEIRFLEIGSDKDHVHFLLVMSESFWIAYHHSSLIYLWQWYF